jgi:isoquinoline 1-oxidoreductase subunit beta
MSVKPKSDIPTTAQVDPSRRGFMRKSGALAGLVLSVGLPGIVRAAAPGAKYGAEGMANGSRDDPRVFIAIGTDSIVTITVHRSEMGQGVRTSMAMVVADELEADWNFVRVAQAPGDETKYGNQDTDGSRSLRHWYEPMRRCGATARSMLEQAAAAQWKVPLTQVQARFHEVINLKTGQKLPYGKLATAAAKLDLPARDALKLKDVSQFRYIGKEKPPHIVDGKDITHGRAIYAIDVRLPGMLHAVVARPPVLGAKVAKFDATLALKVPGVVQVIELPCNAPPSAYMPIGGVAVVAKDTWSALQGRKALQVEWTTSVHDSYDSVAYRKQLEASVRQPGGKLVRNQGDVYPALRDAAKTIAADYYVPHLAHAPMEPPSAVAQVANGKCDIWAGCQSPQAARSDVAKVLKLPLESVTVNVTLLGGGFGRRSQSDFVVEAALLSHALKGAPVKVTWTREDDLHHDYFHAVSAQRLEAGWDAGGKVTAWLHRTAEPTFMSIFMPDPKQLHAIEIGLGLAALPFDIPNIRIENPAAEAHVRTGWLRSVNNIQHVYAAQSFIAEMAAAQGRDHKDLLLELIGKDRKIDPTSIGDEWNHGESPEIYPIDTARLRGVVELVTKKAGWGRALPKGSGLGLAAHYGFVTYIATVIQAQVDAEGNISIPQVDIAVDCGPQVNPERIRSQIEGACINGLSHAMMSEMSFKNGRAEQDNFHQFELLRMLSAPGRINVHLISNPNVPMGGVGEPGVPTIAPALCNAIHAAVGIRIRALPIRNQAAQKRT